MTWSYGGSPGTNNDSSRRDAVRLLIGDVDPDDQQLQDEEISFSLTQTSNDVYLAASISASNIAARYGRLVDTALDDSNVRLSYSQRQKNYLDMAKRLEKQSTKFGSKTLGIPDAGGLSQSEVESVRGLTDRVPSMYSVDALSEGSSDERP